MIGLGRQFISPQQNSGPLFFNALRTTTGGLPSGLFALFIVITPAATTTTSTSTTATTASVP